MNRLDKKIKPNKSHLKNRIPNHDKIYRIKNLSIKEFTTKYPDCVSAIWIENGNPVLELEHIRIKYMNKDQKFYSGQAEIKG